MEFSGISWLAVVVAIVANMVLGFVWYGPIFGKAWMKAVGKSEDELTQSAGMYLVPVISTLVSAVIL